MVHPGELHRHPRRRRSLNPTAHGRPYGSERNASGVLLSPWYNYVILTKDHSMDRITFAWDEPKSRHNQRKHGVSFTEAQSAFFDDDALEFFDPSHSEDEDRFLLLGRSYRLRILLICHCFRERDNVIRIISARRAIRNERNVYKGDRRWKKNTI